MTEYTTENIENTFLRSLYEQIYDANEECKFCSHSTRTSDLEPYGERKVERITYECGLNAPVYYCPGVRNFIKVIKEYARINHI